MIRFSFSRKHYVDTRKGREADSSTNRSVTLRSFERAALGAFLFVPMVSAQEATPGEKTRPSGTGKTYNAPAATYTGKGGRYLVAPQKVKATVTAVDLEKRSISVVPAQKGGRFKVAEVGPQGREWSKVDEMELTFLMTAGMEKIKASKGAAKKLGAKSILLENLPLGSRIKVEYYPVPRKILELTVQRAGS